MEKKNVILSVAIAVYNEEKNLETCLSSIASLAHEIVVVDGGSTDKTIEIARKFTSKIIKSDNPPIFHLNKQKALDACHGEWILQLDADEVITTELRKEILEVLSPQSSVLSRQFNAYYLPRKNNFWGHFMKKGGQYPDYLIRLVRNGKARFPCRSVHEQIEVEGEIGYLREPLVHYAYRTQADYWKKADAYTSLTAQEMIKNGIPNNVWTWFTYNILQPKLTFLSLFIRHKGFMDGWHGFLFAYFSALQFPIAYIKYRKLVI